MFGVPWPEMNDGVRYAEISRLPSSQQGESVLEYYASRYQSSASREGWLRRILKGQIEINGEVVTSPDALIRNNASLVYHRFPWEEPSAPFMLEILYEDEHLLAINKPSGLQVLPGGLFQQRTVLSQLQWRVTDQVERNHPTPVHRLGRGTSGVLLCAKSDQARCVLGTKLASGTLRSGIEDRFEMLSKVYRALVCGIVQDDKISIDQAIGRAHYPGVRGGLYMAVAKGKPSHSKVTTLKRNTEENSTVVEVEIFSGRAHQIRIHLASIGHPLVGDPLYVRGGQPSMQVVSTLERASVAEDGGYERPENPLPGDCGYHLHAHRLTFHHPVTNQRLEIVAPLPPELETESPF
ncbi:RNA pseudouridine synthase 5 [Selaginella moellendorffii]|uniref:RNA pseudouridine synthase 5 n=1 Tax=Selaginella moellendorffii TaxID=88036 RepID=UPI000D1C7DDC|nr:RNA pseudouridine synthase 5 [Selaginella moellendorffii]|eukprot:XP_024527055.1 RNA pseudouridine synthase 5 [Selaginella moellendorffii]